MIWATSIWKLGCSNRSKIHSAQKCYLCLRYVVSPMSPGRTPVKWRRRRDSNPRDPFESNGFQDRRFQPLTHSSVSNSNVFCELATNLLHCAFELLHLVEGSEPVLRQKGQGYTPLQTAATRTTPS